MSEKNEKENSISNQNPAQSAFLTNSRTQSDPGQNSGKANSNGPFGPVYDPPEEDYVAAFKKWVFANNPFYLLSVFLMFWGLYIASVDGATGRGPESLKSLIMFYAVENIYEIIMFAMAVYLLHKRVNQPHGRLLVFFIIIFLCDATMYQTVIANSCSLNTMWAGIAVSFIYFILAACKIGLLIHFLRISICYEALFYSLSSFALIYLTPQIINNMALNGGSKYNVWWVFYAIMIAASLTQLPVILMNWNKKYEDFVEERENKYFGASELYFYKMIVIIPFIAVPVQIFLNAASDLKSINPSFANFDYGFVPYIFFSAFFIQSVFKNLVNTYFISLNAYDFTCSLVIFAIAVITRPIDVSIFGDSMLYPHRINVLIIMTANLAFIITRKNYMSLTFLAALILFYTKSYYYGVIDYFNSSSTMRAAAFIIASFATLAAGFVLSIYSKEPSAAIVIANSNGKNENGENKN